MKTTTNLGYETLVEMIDATLEMMRRAETKQERLEWLREAIKLDARATAALPPGIRVG
jgi:hypothetical protein